MKNTQSELLTQFYKDWLAWLDAGADPKDQTFKRYSGLCTALYFWGIENKISGITQRKLDSEMLYQFEKAGLEMLYPFDEDSAAFNQAHLHETHHTNPKRIQWVRDHVNQENKDQA